MRTKRHTPARSSARRHEKRAITPETTTDTTCDEQGIPFVPDHELLEKLRSQPTPEEIASIGATLLLLISPPYQSREWEHTARIFGLENRR